MAGTGPVAFQNQDPTVVISRDAQTEMYPTLLNHLQGAFGTESQIDMVMPVGAGETINPGCVCSIDPSQDAFVLGLVAGGIPYFAKPAQGYAGTPKQGNVYGDGILALPALASYRLATTEFVGTDIPANTPLTCNSVGKLVEGVYYRDNIVAVVARGILADYDKPGRDLLEFYTYWLPEMDAYSESSISDMDQI